jgi:hypothetical protein
LRQLERVNETLLPESSTAEVAKDIRRLRKLGEPRRPDGAKGSRRSGGAPEGEETRRMRAAIEYLRSMKIRAPYATLAELWREIEVQKHGESGKEYEADSIRSRLRKGDRDLDGEGATLLESWWDIYHSGDLRIVFPGKFPLSRELRELENRAATLSPKKQVLVETSSRWPRRSSRLAVLPPKDQ